MKLEFFRKYSYKPLQNLPLIPGNDDIKRVRDRLYERSNDLLEEIERGREEKNERGNAARGLAQIAACSLLILAFAPLGTTMTLVMGAATVLTGMSAVKMKMKDWHLKHAEKKEKDFLQRMIQLDQLQARIDTLPQAASSLRAKHGQWARPGDMTLTFNAVSLNLNPHEEMLYHDIGRVWVKERTQQMKGL